MDRLKKTLKEHDLDWNIQNAIYDAGHDAFGNYEYLMEYEIKGLSKSYSISCFSYILFPISIASGSTMSRSP